MVLRASDLDDILPLSWSEFLDWVRQQWEQGEHWAILGGTGSGKTTFACHLLRSRRYVFAIDWKGGDKTLSSLGWDRITKLDHDHRGRPRLPQAQRDKLRKGEPVRLLVGSTGRDRASRARRRILIGELMELVNVQGNWTVFAPDLKTLSDARYGGLADDLVEMLMLARDGGVSVITDWQRPSGVPREAGDQTTYLATAYTRDLDNVARLSEMMGRHRVIVRGSMKRLGDRPYTWLVVSRDPSQPLIVTATERL